MGAQRRPAGPRTPAAATGVRLRALVLVAWVMTLLATITLFHGLGRGALAAPPLSAATTWSAWAVDRDAVTIAFVALRLLVLALAWYLLAVTIAGMAARATRAARLVRVVDAVTIPAVRRVLQRSVGLGLATVVLGPATLATLPPQVDTGGHGSFGPAVIATASASHHDRVSGGSSRRGEAPPGIEVPDEPTVEAAREEATAGAREAQTWDVQAGHDFWRIAERVLSDAWGRTPTDREVIGYWRRLIEANRAELADPTNPDLIYPGQRFHLPPTPPDGG